jgi:hypothetical protein
MVKTLPYLATAALLAASAAHGAPAPAPRNTLSDKPAQVLQAVQSYNFPAALENKACMAAFELYGVLADAAGQPTPQGTRPNPSPVKPDVSVAAPAAAAPAQNAAPAKPVAAASQAQTQAQPQVQPQAQVPAVPPAAAQSAKPVSHTTQVLDEAHRSDRLLPQNVFGDIQNYANEADQVLNAAENIFPNSGFISDAKNVVGMADQIISSLQSL